MFNIATVLSASICITSVLCYFVVCDVYKSKISTIQKNHSQTCIKIKTECAATSCVHSRSHKHNHHGKDMNIYIDDENKNLSVNGEYMHSGKTNDCNCVTDCPCTISATSEYQCAKLSVVTRKIHNGCKMLICAEKLSQSDL